MTTALTLAACGSVPMDHASDGGLDATNASLDPFGDGSASSLPDVGVDACGPATQIGLRDTADASAGCKFFVGVGCNGEVVSGTSGWCEASDGGGYTVQGACVVGGKVTSTFSAPVGSCDCDDASVIVTVAHDRCQPQ